MYSKWQKKTIQFEQCLEVYEYVLEIIEGGGTGRGGSSSRSQINIYIVHRYV